MEKPTTDLTVKEIQCLVYDNFFRQGWKYWLFNTFFYKWEADCLAFNDAGQTLEFEVKLSHADYKADLLKEKHSAFRCRFNTAERVPTKFYYVCPWEVIRPDEVPDYAGLIWVYKGVARTYIKIVKGATILSYESANEADMCMLIEKSNQKMIDVWRKAGRV